MTAGRFLFKSCGCLTYIAKGGDKMKRNIGTVDTIFRIVLGLIIIAIGANYRKWWGVIGIIPIITGLTGYCSLYTLLGISTRVEDQTQAVESK